MIYIKTYCYSKHELPFIIAQLKEGYDFIDKLCVYEYNYTHTGKEKNYEMENEIKKIPKKYMNKLYYKKVDLSKYNVYSYNNENLCHKINEPIQRNMFFNDNEIILQNDDIIIDVDCDEIIYERSYPKLISELKRKQIPLSIKLNQFFFKHNYLWTDCNFSSPAIYFYKHVKRINKYIFDLKINNLRDLNNKTDNIYGCHMSWVMPIEEMVQKCYKTAHTRYRHLANKYILKKAIEEKKYIFDLNRSFKIVEIDLKDNRIPQFLQKDNIFTD